MSAVYMTFNFALKFGRQTEERERERACLPACLPALNAFDRAQRLINLEIPVLLQSMKSSNDELGQYLDGRLFKCGLSVAGNP